MNYLKIWTGFRETISTLGDAEKGRLFEAMLIYADSGETVEFGGNERYMWAAAKQAIDYAKQQSETNRNNRQRHTTTFNETQRNTTKRNDTKKALRDKDFSSTDSTDSQKPDNIYISTISNTSNSLTDSLNSNTDKENKENNREKDICIKGKGVWGEGEAILRVCEMLNAKAGTRYRASTKSTRKHIIARFSEGYTLSDFETVIDKKCAEWIGTDMEKYLRPETLFGSKFESYLNAPEHSGGKAKKDNDPFGDMLKEQEARMNAVEVEAEAYPF